MKRSYNVGFLLMSEYSSYNAAFGLAHVLQERGHNVIFLVSDKVIFSQYVTAHGFGVIEIPEVPRREKARFRPLKRLKQRAQDIRLEDDLLSDLIRKTSLDFCLVDTIRYDLFPFALVLAKSGVPTILLFYTFASRFQARYPPVFSSAIASGTTTPSVRSKTGYALLWVWTICFGRASAWGPLEYVERVVEMRIDQIRNIGFERALRQLGHRSTWSEYKRRPLMPEIVFGHRPLDWPAVASSPDRCYFGTTDLLRKSPEFDWSTIDVSKPIIYGSISTARGFERIGRSATETRAVGWELSKKRFRLANRYLEVVLEAFSQRKDWQLILACGPFYQSFRSSAKRNIKIYERLPQLAVLSRADLAITWGGVRGPSGNASILRSQCSSFQLGPTNSAMQHASKPTMSECAVTYLALPHRR